MPKHTVSLDDKYALDESRQLLTGTQAIVRLMLTQRARDVKAGLNTAGYVTGYRGSPIASLEAAMLRAKGILEPNHIKFMAGLNEDLAATALWGSQQAELRGEGKYDGVFGVWYGKGPGLDRTGDVFRHANHAGTSKHGGVLALMGDDHTCESSTSAHQSEFAFVDYMIPVLNPAGVQEILDYGILGFALSRFAGVWVGIKCVKDNIEATATVDGRIDRVQIKIPDDFVMPPRRASTSASATRRSPRKRACTTTSARAILAFARANKLDRIVTSGGANPKIGIITCGKSYLDVRAAFDELGIDEVKANAAGSAPLQGRHDLAARAAGRGEVRRRARPDPGHRGEALADRDAGQGAALRSAQPPARARQEGRERAVAVPGQVRARSQRHRHQDRRAADPQRRRRRHQGQASPSSSGSRATSPRPPRRPPASPISARAARTTRRPSCPQGSRAYAGIGCHYMAHWMDRNTEGFTQMGGEGTNWIGEAPFSKTPHVFQNLGDGTYIHSGSLAIRAARAAGVNMTFKILYNDAVAMTGGQSLDGGMTVPMIVNQVLAEGIEKVVVVTDEPHKYPFGAIPQGVPVHHRRELQSLQKELREVPGVSVLVYDQTCAAEKRRRRKRGLFPDPDKRVFINPAVCEGCGDCGVKSNCVAVAAARDRARHQARHRPVGLQQGFLLPQRLLPELRDRARRQGEEGAGSLSATAASPACWRACPSRSCRRSTSPYTMLVTGVGGTGVVTLSAVLGQAAHLEGKGFGSIDMTGLAQKGGAVACHMRVAKTADQIHAIRAGVAGADLVLGCDLVVTASNKVLETIKPDHTAVVYSDYEMSTADFTRNAEPQGARRGAAARHRGAGRQGAGACTSMRTPRR